MLQCAVMSYVFWFSQSSLTADLLNRKSLHKTKHEQKHDVLYYAFGSLPPDLCTKVMPFQGGGACGSASCIVVDFRNVMLDRKAGHIIYSICLSIGIMAGSVFIYIFVYIYIGRVYIHGSGTQL